MGVRATGSEAVSKQKNTALNKKWYVLRLEARPSGIINDVWGSREIYKIAQLDVLYNWLCDCRHTQMFTIGGCEPQC